MSRKDNPHTQRKQDGPSSLFDKLAAGARIETPGDRPPVCHVDDQAESNGSQPPLWYAYYAEDVDYLRSLGFEVSDRKSLNPDGREVVIVYGVGDLYATGEVPDDVALCYGSGATAVRVVVTPNHRGKMLAELFATGGITADELRSWAENETVQPKPTRVESEHAGDSGTFGTPPPGDFWKKKGNPRPIRATLLPVPTLPGNLVPDPLYPWLSDIAERISCPLDFAVIPAIVALGCALGRKIGMRPKAHDVWTVIPNPWGAIIGRPGVLKSPPLKEALLPLRRLEVEAREIFERELTSYRGMLIVKEAEAKLAKQAIEKAVKASSPKELVVQMSEKLSDIIPPDAPVQRRYTTSDSTMEALGPLLAQHGHIGILRDELTGWFRSLERTDQGTAKAFFLELYDGLGELYQFDRIGRGYLPIKGGTGQVLGGIQPGPWRSLLRAILQDSSADDGLISRLSLLTWPDVAEWKHVDRWPDTTAKNTAFEIYQKLANLDPGNIGAKVDEYGSGMPYLHFDHEAQELFDVWHGNLEVRLRKGDESPLLESHLAKYRKLMPQMSFISYMVDVVANGLTGPVTSEHAVRGLQWCEYLEPHARRAYAIGSDQDIEPALALVEKIKAGALPSPFTSREVYRRHWSNLDDPRMTGCAITVLEEHNWLTIVEVKQERGASREDVYLHPDLPRKGS